MATVTVKRCDVTGKIRDDVTTYRVVLGVDPSLAELTPEQKTAVLQGETTTLPDGKLLINKTIDMCPDAYERLKKFLDRGTTPPKSK